MIGSVNESVAASRMMTEWIYESVNHLIMALVPLDLSSLLLSDASLCPRISQTKYDADIRLVVLMYG